MNRLVAMSLCELSLPGPLRCLLRDTATTCRISLGSALCLGIVSLWTSTGAEPPEQTPSSSANSVSAGSPPVTIRIQSHALRAKPGAVDTISITINSQGIGIAGFDFTLAYDRETFDLISALPGDFPDSCRWEYFVQRDNPKCPGPCPGGLFKIVALAQFNTQVNNSDRAGACLTPSSGAELAKLVLKRRPESEKKPFPGSQSEPLRFFWIDCGDNSVSSVSGNDLFLSRSVSDADGAPLPQNIFVRFPNYTGPTASCFGNGRANAPKAQLRFINALIVSPPIEYVPNPDTAGDSL